MNRCSRLSYSLRGLLNRFGKSRRRRAHHRNAVRCFESLEARLALAGINGPHDLDPAYNPQQTFHIHAGVTIYVNSQKVTVPVFTPEPEHIHTHDASGAIHIHPFTPRTTFVTLNDVFESWRTAIDAGANPNAVLTSTNLMNNLVDAEHSLKMFVNGVETEAFDKYQIHDKDQILLVYGSNPIVTLNTNQGPIAVELREDVTPGTVQNFLTYVNSGAYDGSIFHRFVSGFVLQGGGFESATSTFSSASQITNVATNPAITNEFDNWALTAGAGAAVTQGSAVISLAANADLSGILPGNRLRLTGRSDGLSGSNMFDIVAVNDAANSVTVSQAPSGATASNLAWTIFPRVNILNTIAMAKQGGDPNSATNQFFINLANNDSNLDLQNGGFTVFARVLDVAQAQTTDSTTPANQLLNGPYTSFVNNLTKTNAGGAFTDLPLATGSQLVTLQSVIGDGEVKGVVYSDTDGSGTRGAGEAGRSNVTVFDDANNNQQRDSNEESTTTDASGNYTLRLAPGSHTIRMVAVNATTQSNPANGYAVTVQVGRDITGRDFGLLTLAAPTGIDLAAATDSGSSSTDNVTSFNNSSSQKALQFQVTGVISGAIVQVFSDNIVIGQATVPVGGNGTIVVTTNGSTAISDGTHIITTAQTLSGNTGTMAAASGLSVRIDTTSPQFTSTAPLTASTGILLSYNSETNEESSGVTYTLGSPPSGASINATTGVVSWTTTTAQLGAAQFSIVATDLAGNSSNQAISLNVTKPPQVRVRLAVTNLNGNPITAINVGDNFQLRAFVSDVRANPTGALAIYEDIAWSGSLASAVSGSLVYGTNYNQNTSGTITAGLLDEIGASSGSVTALGSGEFLLFQVNLHADGAGPLAFVGNAADVTPAHNVTLLTGAGAVPVDEIDFGQTAAIQVRQVVPGSLAGFVYVDANNNGTKDTGEQPISGVTITLTGTDSFGAAVSRTAATGTDGSYKFENLNPGGYKIKETQPTGQINNLPTLDGLDTIGSQGGTVSANDELTITLAEGINGTNNNFAELVGHTVGGTVEIDESPGTGNPNAGEPALAFTGVQIALYSADSQNHPVGSPLQSTQINPNGTFAFSGLPTGTYVTNVAAPVFLTGALQNQVIQVGTSSTQTQILVPAVRQARYISYRDFLNSTPRQGVFAAVASGATENVWTAFDTSWSGFSDLSVTLSTDGKRLRIDATTTGGAAFFAEVPVTDPRVRVVAQEGATKLFRLAGGAADYNLHSGSTPATSALRLADSSDTTDDTSSDALNNDNSEGESGEGESTAWPTLQANSVWVPSIPAPGNSVLTIQPTSVAPELRINEASKTLVAIPTSNSWPTSPQPVATGNFALFMDSRQTTSERLELFSGNISDEPTLLPAAVDQALAEEWEHDELDETANELANAPADSQQLSEDLLAFLLDDGAEIMSPSV